MKIFSVPLNPKLSEAEFYNFVNFLSSYKEWIYDVYFTSRIDPFNQDAMGDVFLHPADNIQAIQAALFIQQQTGITISATFNNLNVRPTQQNLDKWIKNFRPLYEHGVRSATIPHIHWMATGQIKKEFPELLVKNTILRKTTEPREVFEQAQAGFDYINIDRNLMRDKEKLTAIKRVKEHTGVKIALLANEGCMGGCAYMEEHYEFNNSRTDGPQYFNDPISRVSCPKWDNIDPSAPLKAADLPPWRTDWEDFRHNLGIDVFKMHGRESVSRLIETCNIIKRYANKEDILFDTFEDFIKETNLEDKPINIWREKIKTCRFECWDCHYCDKIWRAKRNQEPDPKIQLVVNALIESVHSKIQVDVLGLTSPRVQQLLNYLAKDSEKYLEIGSFLGASLSSVLVDNKILAYAVDNWQANIQAQNSEGLPENKKDYFIENIKKYKSDNIIKVFDCDFLKVDKTEIKDVDLFFYDGDHAKDKTAAAVRYFSSCFADTAILIFDDANWEGIVQGAIEGLEQTDLEVIYEKKLLNEVESKQDWWNGLYIVVVKRKGE